MSKPLISVKDLTIRFRTDEGLVTAVEDVSFDINPGEVMGLVGESGSGKSVTAKALMLLNAGNTRYDPKSRITLSMPDRDVDVFSLKRDAELRVVRGGAYRSPANSMRAENRETFKSDKGQYNVGIRVARDL